MFGLNKEKQKEPEQGGLFSNLEKFNSYLQAGGSENEAKKEAQAMLRGTTRSC